MERMRIIQECERILPQMRMSGVSVIDEIRTLILIATDDDLVYISEVLQREYESLPEWKNLTMVTGSQKKAWQVHSALDLLASKLVYFGKVKESDCGHFGLEIDLIPDTIAAWRDEKIVEIINDIKRGRV